MFTVDVKQQYNNNDNITSGNDVNNLKPYQQTARSDQVSDKLLPSYMQVQIKQAKLKNLSPPSFEINNGNIQCTKPYEELHTQSAYCLYILLVVELEKIV